MSFSRPIRWAPCRSPVQTFRPDALSRPVALLGAMAPYPIRPAGAMNKTLVPPQDPSSRQWYLVDAENQTLGRLASEVASVLRGKNNPNFAPHIDAGDFVAFPVPSVAHLLKNPFDRTVTYLVGGSRPDIDIIDYPELGRSYVIQIGRAHV